MLSLARVKKLVSSFLVLYSNKMGTCKVVGSAGVQIKYYTVKRLYLGALLAVKTKIAKI